MARRPRSPADAARNAATEAAPSTSTTQADLLAKIRQGVDAPGLDAPAIPKKRPPCIPLDKIYRGGRKPKGTKASAGKQIRESALGFIRETSESIRDIAPLPNEIQWERRAVCREDFKLFCKTYLPNTFKLGWSESHLICIERIEQVCLRNGKFAIAMPRGHGKTALCRAAILWATLYGHRIFPFLIGSAQPKGVASLEYIKMALYGSKELREDFPEIAYPVHRLENRWHLARGQIFRGHSTYIDWGTDNVRYPILLLTREEAQTYLDHSPGFLIEVERDNEVFWMSKTAGITINTAGVDGSIRGEASVHPILLTQPRPDLVLIDDVQKDNKVDSTLSCDKLKLLIDGAINLLSGPNKQISALMPCTVMREGDVADTYVDPDKRPEWRGERHARVLCWPNGIDDEKITLDSPEGIAWTEYFKVRRQSLKKYKDNRLGTDYYRDHRELMDKNFKCSWDENFDPEVQISAQQACMDLRMDVGSSVFMAECQNKGRKPLGEGTVLIKAVQLREKTVSLQKGVCPIDTRSLVVHIDPNNEIFYWTAFASAPDFSGVICSYGTYPEAYLPFFRKAQTEEWSLLSRMFFEAYPDQRHKATKTQHGYRAPLEAKIYHGLAGCLKYIMGLEFFRDDPFKTPMHINRIGIDTRWGQAADTIKRFVRDWSTSAGQARPGVSQQSPYATRDILVPYFGHGVTPMMKQFEEYTRTRGWLFEDMINPAAKEVRWIWKPDATGLYYLLCDVNRMKTFLFQRLASPPGSPGSVSLFDGPPEVHELFAEHVCESEYPEVLANLTTSLKKEMWKVREGVAFDNDWLDCSTACMALASFNGSILQHIPTDVLLPQRTQRLSEQWKQKREIQQA